MEHNFLLHKMSQINKRQLTKLNRTKQNNKHPKEYEEACPWLSTNLAW